MKPTNLIVLAAALTLFAPAQAASNSNQTLNVQGVLRDAGGNLQTMAVGLDVNLYNAQNAAAPFYTQHYTTVEVDNGFFTVELAGSGLNFAGVPDGWVGIQVSGDPTELPRQHLDAAPYALNAGAADGLTAACSGCITTAMFAAAAKAPLCGTADNATQLNGQSASAYLTTATAATTYEAKLSLTTCGAGNYMRGVATDGTVTCAADANSGGTVTSVGVTTPLANTGTAVAPVIALTGTVGATNGGTGLASFASGQYLRASGANTWAASPIQSADVPNGYVDLVNNQTIAGSKTFSSTVTAGGFSTAGVITTTKQGVTSSLVTSMNVGDPGVGFNNGSVALPGVANGIIGFPGSGWANGYFTYYPHQSSSAMFELTAQVSSYGDKSADLHISGVLTSASDARLKKDIEPLHDALTALDSIHGVRFRWRNSGAPDVGVIAQDVERVFPELVRNDAKGYKSVVYTNLVAVVIEALKQNRAEQGAEIQALKDRNDLLQTRLDQLEAKLEKLASAQRTHRNALALSKP